MLLHTHKLLRRKPLSVYYPSLLFAFVVLDDYYREVPGKSSQRVPHRDPNDRWRQASVPAIIPG